MPIDYKPETGKPPRGVDVAAGVIQASYKGIATTAREAIARRLVLHGGTVACHRQVLLLPPSAPDLLDDIEAATDCYEEGLIPGQRDLIVIFTVRFEPNLAVHRQLELARGFAHQHLAVQRNLAVILVQHLPGLAGWQNKPHVHMLAFARELHGSYFQGFTPLIKPGAKAILANAWADWLAANG